MRKPKNLLSSALIIIFLVSCGKNEKLIQSEETVIKFFNSICYNEEDLMKKYYPNITTFENYYKSDSIVFQASRIQNDSTVIIKVTNYYTTGFGKKFRYDISMFLNPDSTGVYSYINDSKGLTNHKELELYDFAVNVGCINKKDTTDVLKNIKYELAGLYAYSLLIQQLEEFKSTIAVSEWNWKKGYGQSASGSGLVCNVSGFNMPNIKYKISYMYRGGYIVTTDDGYVTYDALRSGDCKTFNFYTSNVDGAKDASISLEFDEDMILEYIIKKDYKGNEYEEYIEEYMEELLNK